MDWSRVTFFSRDKLNNNVHTRRFGKIKQINATILFRLQLCTKYFIADNSVYWSCFCIWSVDILWGFHYWREGISTIFFTLTTLVRFREIWLDPPFFNLAREISKFILLLKNLDEVLRVKILCCSHPHQIQRPTFLKASLKNIK